MFLRHVVVQCVGKEIAGDPGASNSIPLVLVSQQLVISNQVTARCSTPNETCLSSFAIHQTKQNIHWIFILAMILQTWFMRLFPCRHHLTTTKNWNQGKKERNKTTLHKTMHQKNLTGTAQQIFQHRKIFCHQLLVVPQQKLIIKNG